MKAIIRAFKRIGKYLHDVRIELRKVHWPTRKELVVFTSIVLATVVVVGIFFFGLDNVFFAILQLVIRRG